MFAPPVPKVSAHSPIRRVSSQKQMSWKVTNTDDDESDCENTIVLSHPAEERRSGWDAPPRHGVVRVLIRLSKTTLFHTSCRGDNSRLGHESGVAEEWRVPVMSNNDCENTVVLNNHAEERRSGGVLLRDMDSYRCSSGYRKPCFCVTPAEEAAGPHRPVGPRKTNPCIKK